MPEQQAELIKVKKAIGSTSPQELGCMMREYYKKYRQGTKKASEYAEAVKIFNGGLL